MIGDNIAKLRKDRGWTQKELAEIMRLPYGTVACHEANKRTPKPKTVKEYANGAFGVSVMLVDPDHMSKVEKIKAKIAKLENLIS